MGVVCTADLKGLDQAYCIGLLQDSLIQIGTICYAFERTAFHLYCFSVILQHLYAIHPESANALAHPRAQYEL